MAMNGCPESTKDTMSVSPDGVSFRVVMFVILESLKIDVYNSAASFASLSNHRCGTIFGLVVAIIFSLEVGILTLEEP